MSTPTPGVVPLQLGRPLGKGHFWYEWTKQAAPGAHVNYTHTVPGGFIEMLVSLRFLYTSSATVSNRGMSLSFFDVNGSDYIDCTSNTVVPASQAITVNFRVSDSVDAVAQGTRQIISMPALYMVSGSGWHTAFDNFDTTDALSQVRQVVQRFPIGQDFDELEMFRDLRFAELIERGLLNPGG